jgi:hypothetical protein
MPSGYVRIFEPDHPLAKRDGYVLEHRKVVYDAGITIPAGAHVHHLNGDKADNRLENLEVKLPREHVVDHIRERGGTVKNHAGVFPLRTERPCEKCGKPFLPWKPASRFCSRACANGRHLS